jgi:F420-non-reducing hydrogenase iron-sulfur subunit
MDDFHDPKIIAFCCSNCVSAAAEIAHRMGKILPENVKLVQVPCTGRLEILHLLKPFENGIDGVYVAGCQEDSCQYISGITKARKRVEQAKDILKELDIEPERIDAFSFSAAKGQEFADIAVEMVERIKVLGPLLKRS